MTNPANRLDGIADVEQAVADLQRIEIERETMAHTLEHELADVRAAFTEPLADLDADIQGKRTRILDWLKDHKAQFDGPPRSQEFACGTIGYRLGQRYLKPLAKWNWKKVLTALIAAKAVGLIRIKPEVNRDALLASEKMLGADGLKQFGVRVVQDDNPFIETRREPASPAEATE
jgi:phage host-nuclease inhibitor protein Gam